MRNHQKPIVLEIEGVDCVGKTTLAKMLSDRYGFQYLYTPQPPLATIREEVEELNDVATRFFYYLTSVIAVQKMIESCLDAGKSIVIDRYIQSTFVMHQTLGVDVLCVNAGRLPIIHPNFSVLLTAERAVREVRRNVRDGVTAYDQKIEQSAWLLDKAQELFLGVQKWSLVIRTDNLLPAEVFNQVEMLLRGG